MGSSGIANRPVDARPLTNLGEESYDIVGGLRILRNTQSVPTLVVLVHGWRGNDTSTWARTPALLLDRSPPAFDIGMFRYQSGLWPWGRKGIAHLREHLSEDVWNAAERHGYQQVAIAGHSLGGLVAALTAEQLLEAWLRDRRPPLVTGLLPVGTPWDGVLAARFVSWLNEQLRDLASGRRPSRDRARAAFRSAQSRDDFG